MEEITIEEMVWKLKSDETSQIEINEIWENIKNFPSRINEMEFLVAIHQNTSEEVLLVLAKSHRQIIKFYLKKRQNLPQEVKTVLWPPRPLKKQFKGVEVSY